MANRILMIEDNPNNAMLVRRILEAKSIELIHAWDGETGLQMAMEQRPDLILLDLGLPDVDGQTIASFIRRVPDLENIPMIAVTAWPEATACEMAKAYGCDGYITKPIDVKSFADTVLGYLKSSRD